MHFYAAIRPLPWGWTACVRPLLNQRIRMKEATNSKWTYRWKTWLAPTKVPGVWKRKEGGHFVRARVTDPTTGRQKEIKKSLPEADEATAFKFLSDERKRIQAGLVMATPRSERFADYAVTLFERKVTTREIKSARSRERWKITLIHLIAGTRDVPGFGEFYIDQIRLTHVEAWRVGIAGLIANGKYEPTTANGWLAIMRVIMKAAKREFELRTNPLDGIPNFDTSEHATYTEEEPNTLDAERAKEFLACMREECPQHYAMTYLGIATGLRPSAMRPLRRNGLTPDVLWDQGVILVRRSHTLGHEIMNTTKTKLRQRINVPADVMDVLRWHADTQLETPEQRASDLLFPAEDGRLRSEHILRKPFARVSALIGLPIHFTPRGLRRTFNDLARIANVEAIVTKSISGHLTEQMRQHYSTVTPVEQRESIGRLLRLVHTTSANDDAPRGGAPSGAPAPPGGAPGRDRTG
jgi:integrase